MVRLHLVQTTCMRHLRKLTVGGLDIYDHSKPVKKSQAFAAVSRVLGGHTLLTLIDKSVHRARRRLVNQGFSPEELSEFEPVMVDHIKTFCDQLLATTNASNGGWTYNRNVKAWCKSI